MEERNAYFTDIDITGKETQIELSDIAELPGSMQPKKARPLTEEEQLAAAREKEVPLTETLQYYNENADAYYERTIDFDMSEQYEAFLKYLAPGSRILDLGCGSGRDARYFRDQGYLVTAADGSIEMCKKAEAYIGMPVRFMDLMSLNEREIYAGIWANASLVHLPRKNLLPMFAKLRKALTKEGVLFVSFKEGTFEGIREGRHYTDVTEGELFNLVNTVGGMKIVKAVRTTEMRESGEVHWLYAIVRKW